MDERDLPDWGAFEHELQSLRTETQKSPTALLFRGQSDSELRLTTTLERASPDALYFEYYYRLTVNQIKPAIETFTGAKWDVPDYSGELQKSFLEDRELLTLHRFPSVEFYRYMVYLRHNGFPSPLLDWSYSPYVAAFFAFKDPAPESEKRSIYVYCEMPSGHKGGAVGAAMIRPIGPYVRSHARHFRQQSDYTICGRFDEHAGWLFCPHESVLGSRHGQDVIWKLNLPSSERLSVLRLLNDYNVNAFSLFDSEEALLETMWFREHILKRHPRT